MRAILIFVATIVQDLKYAVRQLRSNPGFTAVAVVTLALGIGANTSIFTLLNALLLRPLAVPDSATLVGIYRGDSRPGSYQDFLDYKQRTTAFSGLAADATSETALDVGGTSEVILAEAVSYNYAAVLEINAVVGRWFANEDQRAADHFPAVISYRAWQNRFAADPQVIGKQVRLESQWYTVVGVAPKHFQGMSLPVMTDIWIPVLRYAQHNDFATRLVKDRREGKILMFGRLKAGVSAAQAQAQMNAVDVQMSREHATASARTIPLSLQSVRGSSDPGNRRPLTQLMMLLMAVVGMVLLITCANVANLLLARGVSRRREISIRLALGASKSRIFRQLLAESLLLSIFGAAAGLAAAQWTNRILEHALSSSPLPIAVGASLSTDGRVLGFVLFASIMTTLLFGLIPALQSSKPDLVPALKGSEVYARHRRFSLRNLSAIAQITFSLVLLIVAGLFVRGLQSATHIDPGFPSKGLLSARIYVAAPEFNDASGRALFRRVTERVRNLPGVQNATFSYASPMLTMTECVVPDQTKGVLLPVTAGSNIIGLDYFFTLGIPLIRGRDFTSRDTSSTPPVVIVNESLARRYWPGRDPIGNRIRVGRRCDSGQGTLAEIVGVVKDARYAALDESLRPYVFFPLEQRFSGYLSLLMKAPQDLAGLTAALRSELRAVDARLRIYEIGALSDQIDRSLWQMRFKASLLGAFGLMALLIASVGLYGVIAFSAGKRTREFGIRIALGAKRSDILHLVTGDALILVLAGVGLGLLISLGSTNLLRGLLYGLSPTDAVTFAAAGLVWIAVSLIASCVPAYRATKVDPMIALRYE